MFCFLAGMVWSAPENIALNKRCVFSTAPNYRLCTDPDDANQITDGVYTEGYFWTQKSTVGWSRVNPVILTIDLEKVEPIRGVSWSCAAGVANVTWPECIYVLVSDDGKQWRALGDLCVLGCVDKHPPEQGYAQFRYETEALRGYGRYVCLIVASETYCFVDEVEVWRGEDSWLNEQYQGELITDPKAYYARHCVRSGVAARMRADLNTIVSQAESSQSPTLLTQVKSAADVLRTRIPDYAAKFPDSQRTILPYKGLHEEILSLNSSVLRSSGLTAPVVWQSNRWDPLAISSLPSADAKINEVSLDLMRGEVRGESFNITNPHEKPLEINLTLSDVPGNLNVELREVLFTDTRSREPIAAALRHVKPNNTGARRISVPAGCTRQVWIACRRPRGDAGITRGMINLTASEGSFKMKIPLTINLRNIDFPEHPALHVGGWDYTQGGANYYKAPGNLKSNLALMRDMYVDSPWATRAVFPKGAKFNAAGQLENAADLDFTSWDAWVERWHGARNYCVFFSVGSSFHGEKMGTPRFNTMVGSWLTAWVNHLKSQALKPEQLVILLLDEPHSLEQDQIIITWAAAVKAADQGVVLFEDPTYSDPTKGDPAMFAASDILCPNTPMMVANGKAFEDFYLRQKQQGKTLWLYSCSGPAKNLDPITYHRAQAWRAFQIGAEASFFWAFGCGGGIGDSWHAYKQHYSEYSPYFVGPDSVMEGKHSEAVREGVQDYELLQMLRSRAERVRKSGGDARWLKQADHLLTEGVAEVLKSVTTQNFAWKAQKDRATIDLIRIQVMDALEQAPQN